MGVTLYSNIDYKGDSITEPIFGVHEEMQPDWNDYVNSIKIEPDNAYEWCGWKHRHRYGDSSRSIKKLCDHYIHKWDEDCINANDKVAVGNCDIDSKCWNNSNIITTDLRCKDWCIEYL